MVSEPRAGENVKVKWGPKTFLRGKVLEVYGPPTRRHVVVRVVIPGSAGEEVGDVIVAYPLGEIEPEHATAG